MSNRDDDRKFRNATRGAPPRPERAEPRHLFDHYVHGANESPYEGGYARDGYERGGGFIREDRIGHTPGQRWSGGYGGDRDRYEASPHGLSSGRGFAGSDFEVSRDGARDRYAQDRDREHDRHFGTAVDRAGRMGFGGEGSDMGMGSPDHEAARGPHYGKGPKGYKRSDERTHDDVCDAIAHFGHVDASDVEVKVTDGIVTLTGTIASRRDKRALEHVVERCRGVLDIDNELRVKRESPKPEAESKREGANGNYQNGRPARS